MQYRFVSIMLMKYKILMGRIYEPLLITVVVIFAVCLLCSIWILMKRLIVEEDIKSDTIEGGICVYILIGLVWAMLYYLTHILDKNAFVINDFPKADFLAFKHYSFTVLTTLGLGDIAPVSEIAVNLTAFEAVIGQMFVAVFIARLISLYVHQKSKKQS